MNLIKTLRILSFFISIFIFIYIFYKSEIFWNGEYKNYYKPYYYFSFVLILLSITSFFLDDKILRYLYVFFVSCLIALYLFEAYITFFTVYRGSTKIDSKKIKLYKKETGKNYDTRQKFEIYDDLKRKNPRIQIAFGPIEHKEQKIYSLSGISNVDSILCNENGYYATYKSDRYGFRNDDQIWDKKSIEYLILGDSFAIGECVNSDSTIQSLLKRNYNKNSISLGFGGNGPLTEYATLKEYLQPNMKKIIWLYFEGNDQSNLVRELKSNILKQYLINKNFKQDLKLKISQIDNLLKHNIELEREKAEFRYERSFFYRLRKFIKLFNTRDTFALLYQTKNIQNVETLPEFKAILRSAINLSNENNSKLYFVYLPNTNVIKNSCKNKNKHYLKIKKIVQDDLKIKFISMCKELFRKEKDNKKFFPFRMGGHFNNLGYEEVTRVIYMNTRK